MNIFLDEGRCRFKVWTYKKKLYVYDLQGAYQCVCEYNPNKGAQVKNGFVEAWGPPHKAWKPWDPCRKGKMELVAKEKSWGWVYCRACTPAYKETDGIQYVARLVRKRVGGYRPIRLCEEHARSLGVIW